MKAIFFLFTLLLSMTMIFANDDCLRICTLDYNPLCAGPADSTKEQWRVFANPCDLEVYNCENKSNFIVQKAGEC